MATVVFVVLDVLLTILLTNLVGPGAIKSPGDACQFASRNLPGHLGSRSLDPQKLGRLTHRRHDTWTVFLRGHHVARARRGQRTHRATL